MAVLRETKWLDGDEFPNMQEFLDAILAADGHHCVICGVEQPNDLKWPAFAMELQAKDDGESSGDLEFRTCPAHERQMDLMLRWLGA